MNEIPAAAVREAFTYDPLTGQFDRKDSSRKTREKTGTLVNRGTPNARVVLCLNYKKIYAHRAAWMIVHGDIPDEMVIDHINGNPLDNRIANLRLVTRSINQRNRRLSKRSRTGVTGVFHHKDAFVANCGGEYLGRFPTIEAAAAARLAAAKERGYIHRELDNADY